MCDLGTSRDRRGVEAPFNLLAVLSTERRGTAARHRGTERLTSFGSIFDPALLADWPLA